MEQSALQNHLHTDEEVGKIIKTLRMSISNNSGTLFIRRSAETRRRPVTGELFGPET